MYRYYGVVVVLILVAFLAGMLCAKSITKLTPANQTETEADSTDRHQVDSIRKKVEAGDFQIDLKAMNAICVKRTFNTGILCTFIMYKDKDSVLKEQYFTCSEEKHKELVEQFKRQIGPF